MSNATKVCIQLHYHLRHLVGTNLVPTDRQRILIRKLIREGELDILNLDKAAYRDNYRRLGLVSYVAQYRALLSPVRHLPVELLVTIFELAIEGDAYPQPRENAAPLSFSQVCTMWRKAAFGAPQLWSQMDVSFSYMRVNPHLIDTTKAWLSRGDNFPRDISMSIEVIPSRRLKVFTEALVPYCPFIRTLTLDVRAESMETLFSDLLKNPTPLLEHLDLNICSATDQEHPLWTDETVLNAPRLRSLVVTFGGNSKKPLPIPVFPCNSVKKLVLGPLTAHRVMLHLYLGSFPNVEDCTLSFDRELGRSLPIIPNIVVAPSIRTLKLVFKHRLCSLFVFSSLTLPSITKLTLWFSVKNGSLGWQVGWPHNIYLDFQIRSGFALDSLTLHGVPIRSDELHAILLTMESIVELELLYCAHCIDEHFCQMLTYSETGNTQPLSPLLQKLTIKGLNDTVDGEALGDMIKSRWWEDTNAVDLNGEERTETPTKPRIARLRYVRLVQEAGGVMNMDLMTRFTKCCLEGLDGEYHGEEEGGNAEDPRL